MSDDQPIGDGGAEPVRVLVADGQDLVRHGVRAVLDTAGGFVVAGEAAEGYQLVTLALTVQPDVILLDLDLVGPNTGATIRHLAQALLAPAATGTATRHLGHTTPAIAIPNPATPATATPNPASPAIAIPNPAGDAGAASARAVYILPLGTRRHLSSVGECLAAGAAGFLLKEAPAAELVVALREVVRGGKFISPAVLKHTLLTGTRWLGSGAKRAGRTGSADAWRTAGRARPVPRQGSNGTSGSPGRTNRPAGGRTATLTVREREILECVTAGLSNREAAGRLCLSVRTVEAHKARIVGKLGLRGARDLVRAALEQRDTL